MTGFHGCCNNNSKISQWSGAVAVSALAIVLGVTSASAGAQTHSVLYSFQGGTDGSFPSGLTRDKVGNLYGTTQNGGRLACRPGVVNGCGTVFKIDASGKKSVLYNFSGGVDGANPDAGVIRDAAGNLYGTTLMGGDLNCNKGIGCGTIFKLEATGKKTVLYSFTGAPDAAAPGGLVQDAQGNFYGSADLGGSSEIGAVFKLDTTGKETVLHSFSGSDGEFPWLSENVIVDSAGNLYGTGYVGGDPTCGCGTVFKLNVSSQVTVLHAFTEGTDGGLPQAGVIRDAAGNLYGTTQLGGSSNAGTVFKVDTAGNETVLYSFTGAADGKSPFAGVTGDAAGNLYGTTNQGGDPICNCGTVFKLDKTRKLTVLHTFIAGADGASPFAGVILDSAGNLYGTTVGGGTFNFGTVFKITP